MTFVKLTIMTLQYPVMLTFAMTGHNDFYIDRMTTKNDFVQTVIMTFVISDHVEICNDWS